MKKLILAATLGATMMTGVPEIAAAQPSRAEREYRQDMREARRDYREARQDARRDAWRNYNRYDYNRLPPGQRRYYAENYYRDGRYYQPRRLTRNDRIYRGNDGRYYCRRSDGTTGLIVGAAVGGLIGNSLGRGDSGLLATLLGAGAGAALGSSIDRGNVSCR